MAGIKKTTRSAGVVIVRREGGQRRFLLLRAFKYWDFPKGGVEEQETQLAAAIREVEEETGITDLNFRWGEAFIETQPYGPRRKVARYYLAETPTRDVKLGINPELGRPEHHEYRWVTTEQAQALLGPRVRKVLDWALQQLKAD